MRSRSRVVTSVADQPEEHTRLDVLSVSSATLPPGQYENGIVSTAQASSVNVITISWRRRTIG